MYSDLTIFLENAALLKERSILDRSNPPIKWPESFLLTAFSVLFEYTVSNVFIFMKSLDVYYILTLF